MKYLSVLLLILFFSGCVEVGFRSPQPERGKTLDQIPPEMIQFYTDRKADSTREDSQSLDGFIGESIDKEGVLSENTILKRWKGRYFLNQKEDSLWYIVMIVPKENNIYETYKMDGGNENTVKILKGITHTEEIFSDKGDLKLVIINPSPSEFKKIIKSGAFEKIEVFD